MILDYLYHISKLDENGGIKSMLILVKYRLPNEYEIKRRNIMI